MNQLVLWFDIVSFALMTAAAGLTYIVYNRNRAAWLRDYLVYSVSYGLWVLFAGWIFFQQVYLSGPVPALSTGFAYVRAAVSFVIAWYGPMFLLKIDGSIPQPRLRLYVGIGVGVLIASMLPVFVFPLPVLARVVSIVFNAVFAVLSVRSYRAVKGNQRNTAQPMLPILLYSAIGHTVFALFSLTGMRFLPPEQLLYANVLTGGVFVFAWALIAMIVFGRWIGGRDAAVSVPDSFVNDYQITRRETEILGVLAAGKTAAQIGETLFISQRTVEAHLHNVYRKCGVGNRVELMA